MEFSSWSFRVNKDNNKFFVTLKKIDFQVLMNVKTRCSQSTHLILQISPAGPRVLCVS